MQTKYIIKDKTGEIYGAFTQLSEAEYDLEQFADNDPANPFYFIERVDYVDRWEMEVVNTPSGYYTMQELNGKTFEATCDDAEDAKKAVSDAAWDYFLSLK